MGYIFVTREQREAPEKVWGGGCVIFGGEIVILNEVKNLLAVSTPYALTLVGFEEMLRYAQHDSL